MATDREIDDLIKLVMQVVDTKDLYKKYSEHLRSLLIDLDMSSPTFKEFKTVMCINHNNKWYKRDIQGSCNDMACFPCRNKINGDE